MRLMDANVAQGHYQGERIDLGKVVGAVEAIASTCSQLCAQQSGRRRATHVPTQRGNQLALEEIETLSLQWALQMTIRMTTLRRARNGDWLSRKVIPADVRAAYREARGVFREQSGSPVPRPQTMATTEDASPYQTTIRRRGDHPRRAGLTSPRKVPARRGRKTFSRRGHVHGAPLTQTLPGHPLPG